MTAPDDPADAWRAFCRRLEATGERILAAGLADSPGQRAEAVRHLSRLTTHALQWNLEFHDPLRPAFYRYDDDIVKWGGPNADNHYLRARVDPTRRYRIAVDPTGLRELILSTPEGDMQLERYRVFEERSLAQLAREPDGRIEVVAAAEAPSPAPANWLPLHPDTDHLLVRLYVADWQRDAVPPVLIEPLDPAPPPDALSPETVATGLADAGEWIERTVLYWARFMARRRDAGPANVLSPPTPVPGGAADILYGGGWWRLAPGEVLLIESPPPTARYWSFQLYSAPWFESLDLAHRASSWNGEQLRADADGLLRLVVSAKDPGVPGWLDTEGRPEGMVSYRWVWSEDAPRPRTRVIPLDALADALPDDATRIDGDARRAQIRERRLGLARRFRR